MGQAAEAFTEFKASWILGVTLQDLREKARYIFHEGGSRSSKTFSICAALWLYVQEADVTCDIVRLTNPDLKGSVLQDMIEVGQELGLYDPTRHRKSEQIITPIGGRGRFRYFGIENEQKVHGWKRDILWLNEANEISDAKRRQLFMRTARTIILDVNPSFDSSHWLVSRMQRHIDSGECRHYHSTYKDNPFLEEAIIREIEAMEYDDPWGWQVYGLGKRGTNPAAVFTDVSTGDFDPQGDTVIGVDFGMKDPFVVCEWGWRDSNPPKVPRATLYCRPWIYHRSIHTGDAIEIMDERGVPKDVPMWCDSAEPDRIKQLREAGYRAKPVKKAPGMREAGYDFLKRHRFVVDSTMNEAEAVASELRRTRHKKKPGMDEYTDKVEDTDDHVADTGRYGAFTKWGRARTIDHTRV